MLPFSDHLQPLVLVRTHLLPHVVELHALLGRLGLHLLRDTSEVLIMPEQRPVEQFGFHRRPFVALCVVIGEQRVVGRKSGGGLHQPQHCFL
nr:unnamed protein product [Callosobruchus chinensis]